MNEEAATPDPVVTPSDKPVKKVSDKQYNHLIKARQARRTRTDKDNYFGEYDMSTVDILKPHLKELRREIIEIRKKLDVPPPKEKKTSLSTSFFPQPNHQFGIADNPVYLIVGVGLLALLAYATHLVRKDGETKKKAEPLPVYF